MKSEILKHAIKYSSCETDGNSFIAKLKIWEIYLESKDKTEIKNKNNFQQRKDFNRRGTYSFY